MYVKRIYHSSFGEYERLSVNEVSTYFDIVRQVRNRSGSLGVLFFN